MVNDIARTVPYAQGFALDGKLFVKLVGSQCGSNLLGTMVDKSFSSGVPRTSDPTFWFQGRSRLAWSGQFSYAMKQVGLVIAQALCLHAPPGFEFGKTFET